jgi:cytidylate kinase
MQAGGALRAERRAHPRRIAFKPVLQVAGEAQMAIVTISRGSYSHGREVAEKLAEKLHYQCISREIILSASKYFNIPEMTLVQAVHDAPSVLDHLTHGKQRYLAYVRQALLYYLQKDNIVYHGLAGHYFVRGVPHVLKVRIIADMEDRIAEEMRRTGTSAQEARRSLMKDDEARRRWGFYVFGVDPADPGLYDLAIHIRSLSVEEAVEIIAQASKLRCFQPTPESRKKMHLLFLAARAQALLVEEIPSVKVEVDDGKIVVIAKGYWSEGKQILAKIDHMMDLEKERVRIKLKLTNR